MRPLPPFRLLSQQLVDLGRGASHLQEFLNTPASLLFEAKIDMTSTVATATKATRFRLSCDACSLAKVKCDKKRPECDRCTMNEIPCQYSESRRSGKVSWKKRVAAEREKNAAAPPPVATQPSSSITAQQALLPGGDSSVVACTAPVMPTPGQTTGSGQYSLVPLTNGIRSLGGDNDIHQSTDRFDVRHLWPEDEFATEFDYNALNDPFLRFANSGNDNFEHRNLDILTGASPTTPVTSSHGSSGVGALPTPALLPGDPHNTCPQQNQADDQATLAEETHDCEGRAVSVLRSLQSCKDAHWSSNHQSKVLLDSVPSFDEVVMTNKEALRHWSELMRCQCAKHPHTFLLYISLLAKILFWYRVAIEANLPIPASDVSAAGDGLGKSDTPPKDLAVSSRAKVRPTRVRIGSLDLDQGDQADLTRFVLLRELGRVGREIDEVQTRFNVLDDGEEVDGDSFRMSDWFRRSISHLRDESVAMVGLLKHAGYGDNG